MNWYSARKQQGKGIKIQKQTLAKDPIFKLKINLRKMKIKLIKS